MNQMAVKNMYLGLFSCFIKRHKYSQLLLIKTMTTSWTHNIISWQISTKLAKNTDLKDKLCLSYARLLFGEYFIEMLASFLFVFMLYVPVNKCSVMSGRFPVFLG